MAGPAEAGALYQGRDLAPTLDLRAAWKGVLRNHLGLAADVIDRVVLPGSSTVAPLEGLIRA